MSNKTIWLFGPAATGKSTAGNYLVKQFGKRNLEVDFINDGIFIPEAIEYFDPNHKHCKPLGGGKFEFHNQFPVNYLTKYIVEKVLKKSKNDLNIVEMARGDDSLSTASSYISTWEIFPEKYKENSIIFYISSGFKKREIRNTERKKRGEHFCPEENFADYSRDDFHKLEKIVYGKVPVFKITNDGDLSDYISKLDRVLEAISTKSFQIVENSLQKSRGTFRL